MLHRISQLPALVAAVMAAGIAVSMMFSDAAAAQPAQAEPGVRFKLVATAAFAAPPPAGETATGAIRAIFRISAHAEQAHFYGERMPAFPEFSQQAPSAAVTVWEEQACHQRRGLPKITVIAVGGTVAQGDRRTAVDARMRVIGKRLPVDEVRPGAALPAGADAEGRYRAFRTATTRSRINIDARLYVFDCRIGASN